jgi:hypothetical protein
MLLRIALVFELIAGAAPTGSGWIAALYHEIGDDPMKHGAVIKFIPGQEGEIVHRFRSILGEKLAHDFAPRRVKRSGVLLIRIDRHRRRRGILF